MPLAGERYDCPRCGAETMWCFGDGMRLRRQPGYWLDGDGIDKHVCAPQAVQAKRLADALTRHALAADDYVPITETRNEPGQPPPQPGQRPMVAPNRTMRLPSPRIPTGDVEV